MSDESLRNKTVKGVGWSAIETLLRFGVTFIVSIILARLLTPDEYGLIGILTIFITIFDVIIDGGFINALIRKQDAKDIDYSTVFWTNLAVSIVMALVLFFSSGLIAYFFEREELFDLMRVMSCIVIINALSLVQKARLTKVIDFKSQTKVSLIASISSGLIGILMAYVGCGVWSLVAQRISNSLISMILFWMVNRWTPRFQFSFNSFREMWNFGWKLMLSGVFNNLSGQLHHIVIGKFFSPATLGQYTRAHQFGEIFSGNITTVIQRVTFPVLSEIQNNPNHLKSSYKKLIKVSVFPTFVMMLGLAAVAESLIWILIGEKWSDAAHYLQIISFSMMLFPLHALNLNAIQVMGRSDLTLKINIIKNLLIIFPVMIGIFYGIYWMLIADVIRGYICYYLNAYYTKYVLNYPISEQLKDILPSIKTALIVALPMYVMSYIPISYYFMLILQIAVGAGVFFLYCNSTRIYEYVEIKGLLKGLIGRI